MKSFTLGLKKLPFEQDARQIIYVEGQYDEEVNHFTVTYATDDDRFVELAEYLNNTDLFVNLSFIS